MEESLFDDILSKKPVDTSSRDLSADTKTKSNHLELGPSNLIDGNAVGFYTDISKINHNIMQDSSSDGTESKKSVVVTSWNPNAETGSNFLDKALSNLNGVAERLALDISEINTNNEKTEDFSLSFSDSRGLKIIGPALKEKISSFNFVKEWLEREEFKNLIADQNEEFKARLELLLTLLESPDSGNHEINMILSFFGFVSGGSIQVSLLSNLVGKDIKSDVDVLIDVSIIKSLNEQRTRISVDQSHQTILREICKENEIYDLMHEEILYRILRELNYCEGRRNSAHRVSHLMTHAIHLIDLPKSTETVNLEKLLKKIIDYELYEVCKYEAAEFHCKRLLDIQKNFYGEDHLNISESMNNLCIAYCGQNKMLEQIDLLKWILQIEQKHFGENSPSVVCTFVNISNVCGCLGHSLKQRGYIEIAVERISNSKEKKELIRTITETWKFHDENWSLSGFRTQDTAIQSCSVGVFKKSACVRLNSIESKYKMLGEHEIKQKYYFKRLLKLYEDTSPSPLEMVKVLFDSAGGWSLIGNYALKIKFLRKAKEKIEEDKEKIPPKELAEICRELGNTFGLFGEYKEQQDFLEKSLEAFKQYYPAEKLEICITLGHLAKLHEFLGEGTKQKGYSEQALKMIEKDFIHEERNILENEFCQVNNHESDDNDQYYLEMIGEQKKRIDIRVCEMLSNVYGTIGNFNKRARILHIILQERREYFGEGHIEIAATLDDLSDVYGSVKHHEKQQYFAEEALKIKRRYYKQDPRQIGITLLKLASASGALIKYDKQKKYASKSIKIFEKCYGKEHLLTGIGLKNLALSLHSLEEHEEARVALDHVSKIFGTYYGVNHECTQEINEKLKMITSKLLSPLRPRNKEGEIPQTIE